MIEKVNPSHPDKVADRIAGALVDYCYTQQETPKCAFEVLIGHNKALIIAETSVSIHPSVVDSIVKRIAGQDVAVDYHEVPQDPELAKNQADDVRCGDNGIFKGVPVNPEVAELSRLARQLYTAFPTDGKYILDGKRLIVCQSYADTEDIQAVLGNDYDLTINPLGRWTGGLNVDTGAVNRKLGSDMGEAVTGGGLHGKDLSKADVSVNIYAHLLAQSTGEVVNLSCAIGDSTVNGVSYGSVVDTARKYITSLGGFEKLAEWGIV